VTPIRKVDGNVVIGNGSPAVTEIVEQKFFEIVERARTTWFEYVDV